MSETYTGEERRASVPSDSEHRRVTEKNVHNIALITSDINGIKVGLTNIDRSVLGMGKKLDAVTAKDINWAAIGSLIVAVIIVFGGIFGFLFEAQSNNVQEQLTAVQRESDLRHEIRDLQERNLTSQVIRLQDRVLRKMELQDQLNFEFLREQAEDAEK